MTGKIFDIQRFCTSDGPGIRTTVFFKGCPLRCEWCHNPESQRSESETLFYRDKCTECGRCKKGLPCPNGARRECGKEMTADEIIAKVLDDKIFYKNSGGGLTLSGGEPLYQPEFALELLRAAKDNAIHTAIETCGYAGERTVREIAKYTDLFLFDFKLTDGEKHKKHVGADNALILKNLSLLDSLGKPIILRCPIIPDVNDSEEHLLGIARIANELAAVEHIELEPYHDFGEAKYEALGRRAHTFCVPDRDHVKKLAEDITKNTEKTVKIL